jgi:Mg2+ and Co2+ transporter CorA
VEASADTKSTVVWSESAPLHDLLTEGPSSLLQKRLTRTNSALQQKSTSIGKPTIEVRPAAETRILNLSVGTTPEINIQTDDTSNEGLRRGRLSAPSTNVAEFKHTRRPSLTRSHSAERYPVPEESRKRQSLEVFDMPMTRPDVPIREPIPQRSHTFQTPSKKRDKFQWIHVPANIPGLVSKIMTVIEKDKGNINLQRKLLMDQNWVSNHNRSRHASSHARFIRPFFKLLSPKGSMHGDEILSPSSTSNDTQLALFMPYLHWDTYHQLKVRSEILKRRWEILSPRPIDRKVLGSRSLEHKLIWQFLTRDPSSLHCRRTLDQYGYPSLRDIEARDNDQVLYKKTRPTKSSGDNFQGTSTETATLTAKKLRSVHHRKKSKMLDPGTACVLMVDQLWCWVVSEDVVLTFFAPKEKGEYNNGSHMQADVLANIRKDINGDYAVQVDDVYDFAALTTAHCIRALLENDDPMLQVFRVFEEYISELTEDQVKSFKQFRDTHRVEELSVRKGNPIPQFLDNSKDLNNLLELRDIEDELTTIKKLLQEQHRIVTDMLEQYRVLNKQTGKGQMGLSILMELDHTMEIYEDQVKAMLESSDNAQESYQQLLDMKQKHSNIIEAHLAREQTETAAEQSRSVMIFTVTTIVFLPLSFFSSLFGMNVYEWSGQDTNPSLGYVIMIMVVISFFVIVTALLAAFNKFTRRMILKISHFSRRLLINPLWKLLPRPQQTTGILSQTSSWDMEKGGGNPFSDSGWIGNSWLEKKNSKKDKYSRRKSKDNNGLEELKGYDGELWAKRE